MMNRSAPVRAAIFRREIRLIMGGQPGLLAVVLLAPLFYFFFYGSVYYDKSERDVPVVVVDADHTELSRRITRSLDAHANIAVVAASASLDDAARKLTLGEVQGIVYLPVGFEKNIKARRGAVMKVYVDASRFLIANDLSVGFSEVAGTIGAGIRIRYAQAQGLPSAGARGWALPLQAISKPLFNPTDSYGDAMLPGLMALILQQVLLMAVGISVSGERERGTLSLLTNRSGGIMGALTGKGLPYLLVFTLYAWFAFTVVLPSFHLTLHGSVALLTGAALLLFLSIYGIAFFLASFFRSTLLPLQFFILSSYPAFLLSGYSWPVFAMPAPVRALATFLPTTPYMALLLRVGRMGASWRQVAPELLHLSALALLYVALAALRLKWLSRPLAVESAGYAAVKEPFTSSSSQAASSVSTA